MIFITLGSQKFQFDRLLIYIDEVLSNPEFKELKVFGQIGNSTYEPKNFKFERFLSRKDFSEKMEESTIVITHGGTGAIIGALKQHKVVLAIPRNKMFKEHVDNHQMEIVEVFHSKGFIEVFDTREELEILLRNPQTLAKDEFISNSKRYLTFISDYILSGGRSFD